MRKFFSLIAAVLFAGSMMAADAKVVLDFTDAGWGFPTDYQTAQTSYTNGDYTVILGAHTDKGHKLISSDGKPAAILFGKKDATLTLPAMTFDVSKIIVRGNAGSSGKVSFNVFVGDDAVSTEAKSSLEDHEFPIAADKQAAGTVYVIKVTNANNCQISKVEFYEAVEGAPEDPTFSVAGGAFIEAQEVELACATEGAKIYYTLDGTEPTDASNLYSKAIVVTETTTIKAIAYNNGISSGVVSATYNIVDTEGTGTKEDPFTVADVRLLNNGFSGKAWVIGYIVGCAGNGGAISTGEDVNSNIALGDAADQVENLAAVELPKDSEARANLNIVDNPSNKGAQVKVYGNLVAYFGAPGVKGTSDFELVGGVTPPDPGTQVEVTMVAGENGAELMWTDAVASEGWWEIIGGNDEYYFSISPVSTDEIAGDYNASDLDPEWTWIITETDSINLCAGGAITVTYDPDGNILIAGTLTGSDGNEYVISLLYKDPIAKQTVVLEVNGSLYDAYAAYDMYAFYGYAEDGSYVQLSFEREELAGDFTSADLETQYLGCGIEDADGADHSIFSAEGTIAVYDGGAYEINADVLCYNFTLYKVHLVVGDLPEGIEEILAAGKAVKVVLNGQVIVLKGDKAFNMNGQIVK